MSCGCFQSRRRFVIRIDSMCKTSFMYNMRIRCDYFEDFPWQKGEFWCILIIVLIITSTLYFPDYNLHQYTRNTRWTSKKSWVLLEIQSSCQNKSNMHNYLYDFRLYPTQCRIHGHYWHVWLLSISLLL